MLFLFPLFDLFMPGPSSLQANPTRFEDNNRKHLETRFFYPTDKYFFRKHFFEGDYKDQSELFPLVVQLQALIDVRAASGVRNKKALIAWLTNPNMFPGAIDPNGIIDLNEDQMILKFLHENVRAVKHYEHFQRILAHPQGAYYARAKETLNEYLQWLRDEALASYHEKYSTSKENAWKMAKIYAGWFLISGSALIGSGAVWTAIVYGIAEGLFDGLGASYMEAFTFTTCYITLPILALWLIPGTIISAYGMLHPEESGFENPYPDQATENGYLASYKRTIHSDAQSFVEGAGNTIISENNTARTEYLAKHAGDGERQRLVN